MMFAFCSFSFPFFIFFFSSLRNMPNKQNPFSLELWEILFRKVVCLVGKGKIRITGDATTH